VDITKEQGYIEGNPFFIQAVTLGGYRTIVSVRCSRKGSLLE